MNFKWLSGDFVAEYNNSLKDLNDAQEELDKKYDIVIGEIVKRESARLEKVIPAKHEIGTKVVNSHGNTGIIIGSHIELVVKTHAKSDVDQDVVGPNKYWNLASVDDELVITCEGMLRLYDVEFPSDPLSKDWGVDSKAFSMYADEFEVLKEQL